MAQARKKRRSPTPQHASRGRVPCAGLGELTLVEHSLCPLDPKRSLAGHVVHHSGYFFTDGNRHRRRASVEVTCPFGLSATDEFYLWGLLALTFSQPEPSINFYATPHYCLRKLACIDQHGKRGGRQYQRFTEAIERLSSVNYKNDNFYDPIRSEHRRVSFGFLSYSLPIDPDSSRAWRIAWDPIFFELCQAGSSHFWFDLETYRALDPASRRLFLLLKKIFTRRASSPKFGVSHLGVNVLGLSESIGVRNLKVKVARCVERLCEIGIVQLPQGAGQVKDLFEKRAKGQYTIRLQRGPYFEQQSARRQKLAGQDSPLWEPLDAIGFDKYAIRRILGQFKRHLIQEWSDITLAAIERRGMDFFKRSPQAFFMDNIKKAAEGTRTPPDWWRELVKQEEQARNPKQSSDKRERDRRADETESDGKFESYLTGEGREVFDRVCVEMISQFLAAGQPAELAKTNAKRFARQHLRKRFDQEQAGSEAAFSSLIAAGFEGVSKSA